VELGGATHAKERRASGPLRLRGAMLTLRQPVPLVLVLCLQPPATAAPPDRELRDDCRRIAASAMIGNSMDALRHLTETIGPRLVGSPSYDRAARWAADRLRESGLRTVSLDPYEIPNGWERRSARGRILSPVERQLSVASVGWAPSTTRGGITGEVVLVSDLAPEALRSSGASIRGRIVLVATEKAIPAEDRMAFARLRGAFGSLKDSGGAAVLLPGSVQNNVLGDWVDTANARGTVLPLPVAEIGLEDSLLIRRHLQQGRVSLLIEIQNRVTGPVRAHNVIGEIQGRERPDEWVILGAHLDSWDLGTGAQDNATGSIMVLEAARTIAALRRPPRRSIRFALWAGEEPGIPGSAVYVKAHEAELRSCVAALNMDNGAGHPRGWKVARSDVRDALQPISEEFLEELGGGGLSPVVDCGSDHCPFMLAGIPTLNLWVDTSRYWEVHHKASDTLDKVDSLHFKANAAVVAVTAYLLAERHTPLAPHATREEVVALLGRAGLDPDVVRALWKP
jgi:carboxypeptidase Q